MIVSKRQLGILQSARQFGTIEIGELAAELGVSHETIRRDIRLLVDRGDLIKLHGAVRHPDAEREAPFERRMRENVETKRLIARHAARMIEDGDSVMMDTGTTTSIFARELLGKRGLTVVTNSSDVARTLATVNGNRVYMAGGELHGDNGAAFGSAACAFLSGFNVRHAVISIAAIDAQLGLMDYHLDEAEVARIILKRGERRVVLTDSTKFARTALVRVAGIDEVDVVVTEAAPPHELGQAIADAGTSIEIADPRADAGGAAAQ
ncbi:MAG TPA: DeoR/GlpR family DNA-binding transcription regulator [Thermohalobaculum sp.]|nr:DeoR/GlpR family DNA-binding transcription regulator [Thermohalobaculum sp.]